MEKVRVLSVLVVMVCAGWGLRVAEGGIQTVSYQVSAGVDDGFAWGATGQDIGAGNLMIGDGRDYSSPYQMSGMRFGGVDIPRSAHIVDARLKIRSLSDGIRGQIYGVIQAEAADDAVDFGSRYIAGAVRTAAGVDWDHKDNWVVDTWYVSGDISGVVQEVVDRAGWGSGNALAVYYSTRADSGKDRMFGSFEAGAGYAAELEITYEVYSISGYITQSGGGGMAGVDVAAGSEIEEAVTDGSGYYELKVPPGWSGTVTPSLTDWGFNPANRSYTNITSDQSNQDYLIFQPVIWGYVRDIYGAALESVQITADNGGGSDTTDVNGYYEIVVPYDWSGTVSAVKSGWYITPESRVYSNVILDQANQVFAAEMADIIVKQDGTGDFTGIQAAINAVDVAEPNHTIVVYEGRYYENINIQGKDIILKSTDPDDPNVVADTIIDGGNSGSVVTFSGSESENCLLWGFTITNGKFIYGGGIRGNATNAAIKNCVISGNSATFSNGGGLFECNGVITDCTISGNSSNYGGGLSYCNGSITNCTISGNSATSYWGGGLYSCNGSIINCTISGNSTADYGGGLSYCHGSITNCTISDNSANYGGGLTSCSGKITNCLISYNSAATFGGGLNACSSDIINCTILNNSAADKGGGFYNCDGIITNCTISGNSANYGGGLYDCDGSINNCTISGNSANYYGGGLYNCNSTIMDCTVSDNSANYGGGLHECNGSITNCTVSDNSAKQGGGLYNCNGNKTNCTISGNSTTNYGGGLSFCGGSMINCTILSNSAADKGGGFYNCDGSITNCTISGNSANYGGGLYDCDGSITNCTISGNSADYGGGFRDCDGTIKNCIIWGNDSDQMYNSSTPSYSCIEGWALGGVGNFSTDPNFLADGYHISSKSPCINAGDPGYDPGPGATDIDGDPREVGRIDVGVDEFLAWDSACIYLPVKQFRFSALQDRVNPVDQNVVIENVGMLDLNWSVEEEIGWLTVNPSAGAIIMGGESEVALGVNIGGLAAGNFSGLVWITDPCAINSPQVVQVELEIIGPELDVNSSGFYFETAIGTPDPNDQMLSITNTGGGTLDWEITLLAPCNWLSVDQMSGQTIEEVDEVILGVDTNGMGIGKYLCELTISDPCAENSPQIVSVELHVYKPGERHVPDEYATIQEAIEAAVDGDEVIVQPGVYTGPGNYNISFMGKRITVRSIDPVDPYMVASTIIDPSVSGGWGGGGFYFINNEDPNSVLEGLSIRGCYGPAIRCYYASPTIRNCIIKDNVPYGCGYSAVVDCYNSSAVVSGCIITGNSGGPAVGLFSYEPGEAQPMLVNCVINANEGLSYGAGVYCYNVRATIKNCTITGNRSADYGYPEHTFGAGICAINSRLIIENTIVRSNIADEGAQIAVADDVNYPGGPSRVTVSYSNIQGGQAEVLVIPDWQAYYYNGYLDPNQVDPNTLIWGVGNIDIDPDFVREPNDGGDGWWDDPGTPNVDESANNVYGDVHLRGSSLCINAGDPNYVAAEGEMDIDFQPRVIYGRIDMGADEFGWRGDLDLSGQVNLLDLARLKAAWLSEQDQINWDQICDIDNSGRVDIFDYAILAGQWMGEL